MWQDSSLERGCSNQQMQEPNFGQVVWAYRKISSWLETGAQYFHTDSSNNNTNSTGHRELSGDHLAKAEHSRVGQPFQSDYGGNPCPGKISAKEVLRNRAPNVQIAGRTSGCERRGPVSLRRQEQSAGSLSGLPHVCRSVCLWLSETQVAAVKRIRSTARGATG